jgi:hypothetical protein
VDQAVGRRRLYYGWIQVGTLALTELTCWGILYYAFTVIQTPIERELGWSRSALTGAFSLALLLAGITAVPVGRWLDRHGPRALMTLGSCLATLLLLVLARVQTLPMFYLVWAGIGVAMAMVLYEPAFAVVATWFVRQRSRALTLLTLGGGGDALSDQALSRCGGHHPMLGRIELGAHGLGMFLLSRLTLDPLYALGVFNIVPLGVGVGTTSTQGVTGG